MNGYLHRWQINYEKITEESVVIEAETEHEAIVQLKGRKGRVLYIRKLESEQGIDGPSDQPSR